MNPMSVAGIVISLCGFILWGAAYCFFRKRVRPFEAEKAEKGAGSSSAKRAAGLYRLLLVLACILSLTGCAVAFIARFLHT